jgi:hypothetical protein
MTNDNSNAPTPDDGRLVQEATTTTTTKTVADNGVGDLVAALDRNSQGMHAVAAGMTDVTGSVAMARRQNKWLLIITVVSLFIGGFSLAGYISTRGAVESVKEAQTDNHKTQLEIAAQTSPAVIASQKAELNAAVKVIVLCDANNYQRQGETFRRLPVAPLRSGCPLVPLNPPGPTTTTTTTLAKG